MAELFAIAAGGLGLAPVLLETVKLSKQLKEYLNGVRSAPKDIENLVKEVDCIDGVLRQLQEHSPQSLAVHGSVLQQCVDVKQTLQDVTTALEANARTRRTRTRIAFPLRKEKLRELTGQLERAKTTLLLVLTGYQTRVAIRRENEMHLMQDAIAHIHGQLANQNQNFQQLASDSASVITALRAFGTSGYNAVANPRSKADVKRSGESRITDPAIGLLNALWSIAISGWKHYFRSWRIVAPGDATWFAIHGGDLARLQRLILSNQATIHDRERDRRAKAQPRSSRHWRLHVSNADGRSGPSSCGPRTLLTLLSDV